MQFVVTKTCHGTNGINISFPSVHVAMFIYSTMSNLAEPNIAVLRSEAGAFLQRFQPDFIMVEFWKQTYKNFVKYYNDEFFNYARLIDRDRKINFYNNHPEFFSEHNCWR